MTSALEQYVAAWVSQEPDRIANAVTIDCVITECYGPVYRGRDTVLRWAHAWFGAGGVVHAWDINDLIVAGDREVAQWTFDCTYGDVRSTFDGATVASTSGGLIRELREYQTTADLYTWDGTWRE